MEDYLSIDQGPLQRWLDNLEAGTSTNTQQYSNKFGTYPNVAGSSQPTVQPSATLQGSLQRFDVAPTSEDESATDTDPEDV